MASKTVDSASKIVALGRANKTEAVQIRFDPKRRFVLEMTTRRHNRSLSSLLEAVIDEWLTRAQPTVLKDAENAWSPFASDRFIMQTVAFTDVLTDRELILWGIIRNEDRLWRGSTKRPRPKPTEANFDFGLLRIEWEAMCQKALEWQEQRDVNDFPALKG